MNAKHQLLLARSVYLMVILFGTGLVGFAGFIPPIEPSASAEAVAAIYRSRPDMILTGAVLLMTAAVLMIPFFTVISFQMARIEAQEGRRPILAATQALLGVATAIMTLIPALFYAAAAFRPDIQDPKITLLLNDLGFITLLWPFAPAFFQELAIALCVLSDKNPQPLFPRWIGFFNIWIALLFLPGALIPFFKTGPFAWNGLLAFWVPMNAFFIWIVVMAIYVVKAIKQPEAAG